MGRGEGFSVRRGGGVSSSPKCAPSPSPPRSLQRDGAGRGGRGLGSPPRDVAMRTGEGAGVLPPPAPRESVKQMASSPSLSHPLSRPGAHGSLLEGARRSAAAAALPFLQQRKVGREAPGRRSQERPRPRPRREAAACQGPAPAAIASAAAAARPQTAPELGQGARGLRFLARRKTSAERREGGAAASGNSGCAQDSRRPAESRFPHASLARPPTQPAGAALRPRPGQATDTCSSSSAGALGRGEAEKSRGRLTFRARSSQGSAGGGRPGSAGEVVDAGRRREGGRRWTLRRRAAWVLLLLPPPRDGAPLSRSRLGGARHAPEPVRWARSVRLQPRSPPFQSEEAGIAAPWLASPWPAARQSALGREGTRRLPLPPGLARRSSPPPTLGRQTGGETNKQHVAGNGGRRAPARSALHVVTREPVPPCSVGLIPK